MPPFLLTVSLVGLACGPVPLLVVGDGGPLVSYSAPLSWGLGPVGAQADWIIRISWSGDSDSCFF
jgi:hypothetical protein